MEKRRAMSKKEKNVMYPKIIYANDEIELVLWILSQKIRTEI